jgi:hypothetical protein
MKTKNIWNDVKKAWFRVRTMQHTKPVVALSIMVLFVIIVALVAHRGPKLAQSSDGVSTLLWRDISGQKRSITYIELPKESGRHDTIARDFFIPGPQTLVPKRCYQQSDAVGAVEIYAPKADKEVLTKLSKKLQLQAIILGERPMAFINDSILTLGQTLKVDEDHAFEVIAIEESIVHVKCESARIVLHLAVDSDGNKQ